MTEHLRQAINKITEFHYLCTRTTMVQFQVSTGKGKENGIEKSNGKILAPRTPFSPFKFAHQIFKSWQFL
jgi:hypothetical protein